MNANRPTQAMGYGLSSDELIQTDYLPASNGRAGNVALVFIAGWASRNTVWQSLLLKFNRHYDCHVWTLPGCDAGSSDETADDQQPLWQQPFSLENLLESAKRQLPESCILLGWSLGGMLAMRLAYLQNQKVQGLVTFATNLQFVAGENWQAAMPKPTFDAFVQSFQSETKTCLKRFQALQYKGDAAMRELKKYFREQNTALSSHHYTALKTLLQILGSLSNVDIFKELSQPGLHFFGAGDALVPLAAANTIFEKQSRGQAFIIYPDCGHLPHISHEQDVIKEIESYIRRNFTSDSAVNPYGRDKNKIAKAFSEAAGLYDCAANLQRSCANRLLDYLETNIEPEGKQKSARLTRVLDIGCGTGFVSEGLLQKQTVGNLLLLDLSASMLHCAREKLLPRLHLKLCHTLDTLCMDMDALVLEENSLDLVVSNMSVQWSENFAGLLMAVWQAMKPGARFIFSTVGAGTLYELDEAWRAVDDYVHVNEFLNEEDLLHAVNTAHFICEQHQTESRIQYFSTIIALMKSLKTVGAHNVNAGQNRGLTGRARINALEQHYEKFRTDQGLPATWQLHYLVLRKPYEH